MDLLCADSSGGKASKPDRNELHPTGTRRKRYIYNVTREIWVNILYCLDYSQLRHRMNPNLTEICSVSWGRVRHKEEMFMTSYRWVLMGLVLGCGFCLDTQPHRPDRRAAGALPEWPSSSWSPLWLRSFLAIAQIARWLAPGKVLVVSAFQPWDFQCCWSFFGPRSGTRDNPISEVFPSTP